MQIFVNCKSVFVCQARKDLRYRLRPRARQIFVKTLCVVGMDQERGSSAFARTRGNADLRQDCSDHLVSVGDLHSETIRGGMYRERASTLR